MDIQIRETNEEEYDDFKLTRHLIKIPYDIAVPHTRIGIDPGYRKMGFADIFANKNVGYCCQFDFKKFEFTNDQSRVPLQRMLLVQKALGSILYISGQTKAVIEGSGYAERFRQTQLAEARAAAILKLYDYNIEVAVIPPLKIRKNVFGSGKIKAKELWSDMKPDAAAALACALYKEPEDE